MARGKIVNALYRCQQAVINKIGIENIDKGIKIGVKIKKEFNNGYELIDFLYRYTQRNKFLWLELADFQFIGKNK